MRPRLLPFLALLAACGSVPARGPQVTVTIPRGATFESALDSLTARGVVTHPGWFGLYARVRGLRASLKSGTYAFHADETWRVVADALSKGHGALIRWTVPEGLMASEVADLAQRDLGVPRDSFVAALVAPGLRDDLALPRSAPSVEGYLFPTTYLLPPKISGRELVRTMVREFQSQWDPAWAGALDSLRLTKQQAVTLASIVEAEVRYDPDRPYVAGVYYNRLRRGMKLDADPTVIYAYGHRLKRVYDKNLLKPSPYNTYLHPGLPPGPIAQPGRASLLAAVHPAVVPYLYFVAQPDGKHIFSVSYAEHQAAIARVRHMQAVARAPRP